MLSLFLLGPVQSLRIAFPLRKCGSQFRGLFVGHSLKSLRVYELRVHEFTSSRVHGFTGSRVHGFTGSRINELV